MIVKTICGSTQKPDEYTCGEELHCFRLHKCLKYYEWQKNMIKASKSGERRGPIFG